MAIFLAVCLWATTLFPRPILAATMTFETDEVGIWHEEGHALRCNYRLDGAIVPGDAGRLAAVLMADPGAHTTLCLHSPGGSFSEGIEIAKLLKEREIGAWIEPGKSCLSACAVAFMGGSERVNEVGTMPWRVLSSTARLGFHAPALDVRKPDGDWPSDVVSSAYNVAVAGIGELARTLMVPPAADRGAHISPTLLSAILDTPPEDMMYIDTVGEAGMWDILVALPGETHMHRTMNAAVVPADPLMAVTLCTNALAWRTNVRMATYYFEYVLQPDAEGLAVKLNNVGIGSSAAGCTLRTAHGATLAPNGRIWSFGRPEKAVDFASISAYPPEFPLKAVSGKQPSRRICYRELAKAETASRPCTLSVQLRSDRLDTVFSFDDGSTRTISVMFEKTDWSRLRLDGELTGHKIRATPRGYAFCLGKRQDADFCYRLPLD